MSPHLLTRNVNRDLLFRGFSSLSPPNVFEWLTSQVQQHYFLAHPILSTPFWRLGWWSFMQEIVFSNKQPTLRIFGFHEHLDAGSNHIILYRCHNCTIPPDHSLLSPKSTAPRHLISSRIYLTITDRVNGDAQHKKVYSRHIDVNPYPPQFRLKTLLITPDDHKSPLL